MKKSIKYIISIFSVFLIFIVLLNSNTINEGVRYGINLCINNILPSLYIFTLLSIYIVKCDLFSGLKILSILAKLLNINKHSSSVYLLSLISGYPIGAKLVNELYKLGKIDIKTAKNMLLYSINPSPAFIISVIGIGIYNNINIGFIILTSSILSSVFTAFLLRYKNTTVSGFKNSSYIDYKLNLLDSIKETNYCMITICSWVIIANVFIFLLNDTIVKPLLPLFEVMSGMEIAKNFSIYYISFLVGFGGITVIMQVLSMLDSIKIKYEIIIIKIINGLITTLFSFILFKFFPQTLSVANLNYTIKYSEGSIYSSIVFVAFIITSLIYFKSEIKKCRN